MNKIVVLGGGTAGWITALMMQKYFPEKDITVVESEEIGILGAGEGTTPDFVKMLSVLEIDITEIIKYCDGSFKIGITFTNWNGDGNSYFHSFGNCFFDELEDEAQKLKNYCVGNGIPIQQYLMGHHLVNNSRIPFFVNKNDGLLDTHGLFALHFNARKLAVYLKTVAESRGVKRVEGRVVKVENNNREEIDHLVLETGQTVPGDFFFDCSGFARLLIGKHYSTEWISYHDRLPLDTALPFFVPHDNKNLKPHTEAIAMKYGWCWKIPVKDRYGCGYVYDSEYIDHEQAVAEIKEYFGEELTSNPKSFKFKAGMYRDTIVKNCMAVGLSQSFVEPLEATSIWAACINLRHFAMYRLFDNRTEQMVKMFNESARRINEQIVNFLYIHYLTKRSDSDFWKEFRKQNQCPQDISEFLQFWHDYGLLGDIDMYDMTTATRQINVFAKESWLQVCDGLGLLNPEIFKKSVDHTSFTQSTADEMQKILQRKVAQCIPHDFYLEMARNYNKSS